MLETEIKKLTAAVTELNATIKAGGVAPTTAAAPAPAAAPAGSGVEEAPAPAAEPVMEVPADDAVEVPADITKKQLTEKFIELAQAKGREVAAALLAEYGIAKLPELTDKAQWPAFYTACVNKLAA